MSTSTSGAGQESRSNLETQLNDFSPAVRDNALDGLIALVKSGAITLPPAENKANLHCHSFHSFNAMGYSPSFIAWKARTEGLVAAGIVDFDVLEGVDEFLSACQALHLRGCAGFETRVFIPQRATKEINSPGEPGIAYHMGVGFASGAMSTNVEMVRLKEGAQHRNRAVTSRVNEALAPVMIDFDVDVLPMTPTANPTERHLCEAYAQAATKHFADEEHLIAFWTEKLGVESEKITESINTPSGLQSLIRSKMMKRGGVGYVAPDGPSFPLLEDVNALITKAGAIPALAWLDGTSAVEINADALLSMHQDAGTEVLNIIPERNWNVKEPTLRAEKCEKLYEIVAHARERAMPVIAGTEMNAPGQPFVDNFEAPELAPVIDDFLKGAFILYAHTRLQAHREMGYMSTWASQNFQSKHDKNNFYRQLGETLAPSGKHSLQNIEPNMQPSAVLKAL